MKHAFNKTNADGYTTITYGEKKHGDYYVTVNVVNKEHAVMTVWYHNAEGMDYDVAAEYDIAMLKHEVRKATGNMMARLCEGGYHFGAIHLLADFMQDLA